MEISVDVGQYIKIYCNDNNVGSEFDFHIRSSVWPNRSMLDYIISLWVVIVNIKQDECHQAI